MAEIRHDFRMDVTAALPLGAAEEPVEIAATLIADPQAVADRPVVLVGIPGGTYHRRYWDLRPPGRAGYSMAAPSTAICTLTPLLPALADPVYVGIGQSLGGYITIMQQGKYADYPGIGVFGASPRRHEGLPAEERRRAITADNAKTAEAAEVPAYHGASRETLARIFHIPGVAEDLLVYDEAQCHTLISRVTATDAVTPGIGKRFADRITLPVFLAFGDTDVSQDPRAEPSGYPRSGDITLVVMPRMGHMHNFADTRELLWERFYGWLPVVTGALTSL
jgi:pimeloyl-ACP methyl ester carboxylesterase